MDEEVDTLDFPYNCPICGTELDPGTDIDLIPRGDRIISMLYCPKCNYKKKLSDDPFPDVIGEEIKGDEDEMEDGEDEEN